MACSKPTNDGIITSVEAFDADGKQLVLLFGERENGKPEMHSWRELLQELIAEYPLESNMLMLNTKTGWINAAVWLVLFLCAVTTQAENSAHQRIVSIDGALTEIVYALDAGDRLVAVDTTSRYPQAATTLPDVGYMRRYRRRNFVRQTGCCYCFSGCRACRGV